MPRQPQLRRKKVGKSEYWYTRAGGETYFGNVNDLPYSEAKKLFADHIKSVTEEASNSKGRKVLSAAELMDLFLDWLQKHRSDPTYKNRRTHCNRFAAFRVETSPLRIADLPATQMKDKYLEDWLAHLENDLGLSDQTRRHAETSIKHCWNWATKHPSPIPYLSPTYRPFSGIDPTYVAPKALAENDLITEQEIHTLFAAAEVDLDQFHRFGLKAPRSTNPYCGFADLLRCYYHTGARTGELAACTVGDVLFRTGQVILGKHKRSRTQREPTIRHITLNDEALGIFTKQCQDKSPTDKVFLNSDNRPWSSSLLPKRFDRVKEVARLLDLGEVRDDITIYSFRDLWISEALMAGNDVATVAKMAGTSIAMIERVYGHFRNEHLQEAQRRLDEARRQRRA